MTAEQFKHMMWLELGRLPKPNQNPGESAVISVSWHDDKNGDDWISVEVKWMPKGWQNRKDVRFNKAAITAPLKNIPDGTSLESTVHTLCEDLRGQIEVKNALDYSECAENVR